ncbi:MAG: tRNA (guanosine(46)-N7)-methyltransferase TrmB [Eubacterium sp.]
MRLRNVSGSHELILASEYVIKDEQNNKGNWSKVFKNNNPIHIEVGMGKGKFLTALADMHPEINYIGIERYSSVLVRALDKRNQLECNNLYFICMDARNLTDTFDKGEVSKIYLNFSDPWPKDRHAKRRLTSKQFMDRYDYILKPDGVVEFKTDNKALFEFSLEQIPEAEWKLDAYTFDLHNDGIMNKDNVMTEYEEKFSSMGNPIYKLIASR